MIPFPTSEKYLSQVSSWQLLIGLGYEYLTQKLIASELKVKTT